MISGHRVFAIRVLLCQCRNVVRDFLGYDGFGEVMRPSPSLPQGSYAIGQSIGTQPDRLIQSDLDGSLALLAGNLSIRPDGQMKKYATCTLTCSTFMTSVNF